VSFRLVPRYPIDIGTHDIIVVACARGRASQRLTWALGLTLRRLAGGAWSAWSWLTAPRVLKAAPIPAHTAELHRLPSRRLSG